MENGSKKFITHQARTSLGYYLLTIRPAHIGVLLKTNSERAFVITQLQDMLSPCIYRASQKDYQNVSSHIDLLAFSVLKEAVQLLVFSISDTSPQLLATTILERLSRYRDEYSAPARQTADRSSISLRKLVGVHEALNTSVQLHLNHQDWESDRYSSVGFFLHDRRGDWMRLWRLTHLYENNIDNYYGLLQLARNDYKLDLTLSS